MNKREKTLLILVLTVGSVYGGSKVVWPMVDRYVFAVARENEDLRAELVDKDARVDDVEPYRRSYAEFLARTGSTDVDKVRNAVHARLTRLIDEAGLSNPRVSPRAIADYRAPDRKLKKTGIKLVRFSVTAEGRLESIVAFLKSLYELSYISRVTGLKLDPPTGRAARGKQDGPVKLTASVEALVPPKNAVSEVNLDRLKQPAQHVKHSGRDFTVIASRQPFTEYHEPPPPPPPPRPVSHVKPRTEVVRKEPAPVIPTPPPPPAGDPARRDKVVRMVMMYGDADASVEEVLVVNTRDKSSEYVRVGEKLDGGDVILVHPTGAASRRPDGSTRVYGVGRHLSDGVLIEAAAPTFPEILYAYDKIKDRFAPEPEAPDDADNKGEGEETEKKADAVDGGDEAAGKAATGNPRPAPDRANPRVQEMLKMQRERLRNRQKPPTIRKNGKPATAGGTGANKKEGSDKHGPASQSDQKKPASKAGKPRPSGGKKTSPDTGKAEKGEPSSSAGSGGAKKAAGEKPSGGTPDGAKASGKKKTNDKKKGEG